MAISHIKSNAVADFTGTITGFNSQGSTTTIAATNLVRPSDWNSVHNEFRTLAGNTNNASTLSGSNIVIHGLGGITLRGSNNNELGISCVPPGTATMWFPYNEAVNVAANLDQGRMFFAPVPTPTPGAGGGVHIDRLAIPIHFTHNAASTGSITLSLWFGLYTKNASTLSLAHSTSITKSWVWSSTVSQAVQFGIRLHTIPWTTTIDDGRYYVANIARSTNGGNNATLQHLQVSAINSSYSGIFGQNSSDASQQWPLGFGAFSATTSALRDSIAFSEIVGRSSAFARPPTWFMISGTA